MKTQNNKRSCGFTLVELLVVIAIIAVLSVVALSIGPKAMKKSRQTTSMGNMRQMAILMNGYAAENGGKLPAPREDNSGNNGSTRNLGRPASWHWHQAIIEQTFPNVERSKITSDIKWWKTNKPIVMNPQFEKNSAFAPWFPGYAMNIAIARNVEGSGDFFKASRYRTHMSSIPDPARTPLIIPHWDWHSSRFLAGTALNSNPLSNDFMIDGKMNITFVDGHSELIRFAKSDGTRLNVSEYSKRGLDKHPIR